MRRAEDAYARLFLPRERERLDTRLARVTSIAPLRARPHGATTDIGPLSLIRALPAIGDNVVLLRLPNGWAVVGNNTIPTPPSSMIQINTNISTDRADNWRLITDRTYSATNITDGDIVLIADIWEANAVFTMPDELWASDSSFQYNLLYRVQENRIGFRLFWHKFTTGDNTGAMSVFTGGGAALWDDPASWPDPFNEQLFVRRAVWRIRGAHLTNPFPGGVAHLYDADGNTTLALPSHVAALDEIVIAMGCFTSASSTAQLGNPSGSGPGFTNITNNNRGPTAPGMGLSLSHTVGSPFAGTISGRTYTNAAAMPSALSAIFAAKGA